jgi:serine/threonine protein kinase
MGERTRTNDSGEREDAAKAERADGDTQPIGQAHRAAAGRDLGSVVANRYVLKSHLGTGRYGEIYEAVDRSLSDPQMRLEHSVALHLLHPRIAKHTRLLQKLESSYLAPHLWAHPNVVKVSGFGCDAGRYYVVMELLDGATLRALLDATPLEARPEADTFAVLRGVGDALKYAHANGVIHGDVRPEKVFVTRDDAIKVLDLLPASTPRTQAFFVEDAEPNGLATADPRDDVYGLACIAYEILSGRRAFDGRSPLEALNARAALAPIPGLGVRRSDALARALRLRREHRTPNVAEFLADFGITGQAPPRPIVETASAPPARAPVRDDDVPIIGDYSHRVLREPPPEPPLHAEAQRAVHREGESWRLDPRDVDRYSERAKRGTRGKSPGTVLRVSVAALAAVAAGIVVYWNYEPLRSRAEEWLALTRGPAEDAASTDPSSPPEPEEIVVEAPVVVEAADLPAEVVDVPQAAAPPTVAPPELTAPAAQLAVPVPPEIERPAPEPGVTAPPSELAPAAAESVVSAPPPEPEAPAAEPAVTAPPAEPPAPEAFELATAVVSVSEREAGARVTIRRRGGDLGESSIVWWTSDGSATAGDDYADLGRMTERFAAGEETRRIYVPIVGDSTSEATENFFVNLGQSGEAGERLEPAGRAEITVVDDD